MLSTTLWRHKEPRSNQLEGVELGSMFPNVHRHFWLVPYLPYSYIFTIIYYSFSQVISIIDSILILFRYLWFSTTLHPSFKFIFVHIISNKLLGPYHFSIIFQCTVWFSALPINKKKLTSTKPKSPHWVYINWAIYLEDNCGYYLDTISINSICAWGVLTLRFMPGLRGKEQVVTGLIWLQGRPRGKSPPWSTSSHFCVDTMVLFFMPLEIIPQWWT